MENGLLVRDLVDTHFLSHKTIQPSLIIWKMSQADSEYVEVEAPVLSLPELSIPQYRHRPIVVDSNAEVDITELALQKYKDFKDEYRLVPLESVNNSKKLASGSVEPYAIPTFQFNEEYINYQKNGYSINPNPSVKGVVFNEEKFPQFAKLQTEIGAEYEQDHPMIVEAIYNRTSKKARQEKT